MPDNTAAVLFALAFICCICGIFSIAAMRLTEHKRERREAAEREELISFFKEDA